MMALTSNGSLVLPYICPSLLWYITLVVILVCNHMSSKTMAKVPICKTNKVKTNCDSKTLTFLWTIKRRSTPGFEGPKPRGPTSYFFGTIHVPYSRVWDSIPNRVKLAFQTSDRIIFELDLMDAYTVSTLANCQLLPNKLKLSDILPRDLYKRLRRHLDYVRLTIPNWVTSDQKARGLYAEYLFNAITGNWERKRPVWVMLMINSLNEFDIKSRGIPVLDLYLAQEAKRLNKNIGSIEKVEEQCIPLNGLNYSEVVFALNQTLCQNENLRRGISHSKITTDDLIRHYNCGDLNQIIFNYDSSRFLNIRNTSLDLFSEQMAKRIDDYFRSELIVKRNERMSKRVVNILKDNPNQSFFFAFGAGHFLGNSSILEYMKDSGFDVNRVSESMNTKRYRLGCRSQHRKHILQKRIDSIGSEQTLLQKTLENLGMSDEGVVSSQGSQHFNLMYSSNRNNDNKNPENRFVVSTNDPQNDGSVRSMQHLISPSVKSRGQEWQTTALSDVYTRPVITTSSPKHTNRRFNDLWVRLETVPKTESSFSIPHQMSKDVHLLRDYVNVWHSSGTSRLSSPSLHSVVNIVIVVLSAHILVN